MLRIVRACLYGVLCSLFTNLVFAEDSYPSRPIRLIVPFAPGGGTDINARIIAPPMGNELGGTIVVENRPGAASMIGSDIVAKAAPDGYTLLLGTISLVMNAAIYKHLPFDFHRDLVPITRVSDQPSILVVNPALPAKTLKEFIALARTRPGEFNYGSPGYGSGSHLASELLWSKIGVNLVHIPFKGTGPALNALIGDQITAMISTFASALPYVQQGRLRAYAVTTLKRAGPLPDVPTLAEQGVQDYEYAGWYGLFAPTGTPNDIIDKLHKAAIDTLKSPDVLKLYTTMGLNATPTTPTQFAQYVDSEARKWAKVVRERHIALQ